MVNRDFRGIICPPRLSLSRERLLLLYGYYNSEQQFVQVNFVQTISRRLRSNQIWCIILSMKHFWREVYAKRQFFQSLCSAVGFAEVQ